MTIDYPTDSTGAPLKLTSANGTETAASGGSASSTGTESASPTATRGAAMGREAGVVGVVLGGLVAGLIVL